MMTAEQIKAAIEKRMAYYDKLIQGIDLNEATTQESLNARFITRAQYWDVLDELRSLLEEIVEGGES